MKTTITCSPSLEYEVSTETEVTAHLASATPLIPLWFYTAEREIQSPSRAAEEVLAAGRAGRFLRNQSTIVTISFPSQQNEEICSFFCNQWQMSVWPEDQVEQTVGCAIRGSIYGRCWEQRIKCFSALPRTSVHVMSFSEFEFSAVTGIASLKINFFSNDFYHVKMVSREKCNIWQ